MKAKSLIPVFVESVPASLEARNLYISMGTRLRSTSAPVDAAPRSSRRSDATTGRSPSTAPSRCAPQSETDSKTAGLTTTSQRPRRMATAHLDAGDAVLPETGRRTLDRRPHWLSSPGGAAPGTAYGAADTTSTFRASRHPLRRSVCRAALARHANAAVRHFRSGPYHGAQRPVARISAREGEESFVRCHRRRRSGGRGQ